MKVFGKERKKQLRQLQMDIRDAKAFNIILWFVLNAIAGVLNFGPKRLQRICRAIQTDYRYNYRLEREKSSSGTGASQ